MDVREVERDFVDWHHPAQDTYQWRGAVNMLMNLRVP